MAINDREVLIQLFRESKISDGPGLDEPEYFELYVPYHYLKGNEIDFSDIEQGIVDGPNDGGIDSIYALCDGRPIAELDPASTRKGADLELWIFSTKYIDGFKINVLDNIRATLNDLLTLDNEIFSSRSHIYNEDVVLAFSEFRTFYRATAAKFPDFRIRVVYATRSATSAPPEVETKIESIRAQLKDLYSSAKVHAVAADARQLLERVGQEADEVRSLEVTGNTINQPTGPSYVALSRLKSYARFISRDDGTLEARLFDDNVRDYEGDVSVNKEIADTLKRGDGPDFWWLNNGVSIICDAASLSGSTLQIRNPKIVNGLQTSRKIFEYFSTSPGAEALDDRLVLVRVVSATDEDLRAEIIAATNRQTPIQPSQLKTTSMLHRNLETFLRGNGVFYERRKNYWRNHGKKKSEIVSVTEVAQAIITCVGGRPHSARARPGGILKSDAEIVFNDNYALALYLKAIRLVRSTEALIEDVLPAAGRRDRNNVKFQVVGRIVAESTGGNFGEKPFENNPLIPDARRAEIIQAVYKLYQDMGATDAVAKSEDFWNKVKMLTI